VASGQTKALAERLFRERGMRIAIGGSVLAVHAAALAWLFNQPGIALTRVTQPVPPLSIFSIAPPPIPTVKTALSIASVKIDFDAQTPVQINIDQELLPQAALAKSAGAVIAPHPFQPLADSKSFAQQAGVFPGAGALVVLRVEVYGNGDLGRVVVDVSGGSSLIDNAAIAYVHALNWRGGRVGNRPETLWIRWGVRFEG